MQDTMRKNEQRSSLGLHLCSLRAQTQDPRQQFCSWICPKHLTSWCAKSLLESAKHRVINTITDTLEKWYGHGCCIHLAAIVASSGGLPRQLKVPAHICNMVGRLHDQTWFQIEPGGKLIMTTRGSRQGCRFRSVMFNAVSGVTLF